MEATALTPVTATRRKASAPRAVKEIRSDTFAQMDQVLPELGRRSRRLHS